MTPEQKLKHAAILVAYDWAQKEVPKITADNVDEVFRDDDEEFDMYDAANAIRSGAVETQIPCESSRHYESKSVAGKMNDGSWVGWTYWYGGGKHGEPEAIGWMEDAYDLDVTEEERVVTVRTFVKK